MTCFGATHIYRTCFGGTHRSEVTRPKNTVKAALIAGIIIGDFGIIISSI